MNLHKVLGDPHYTVAACLHFNVDPRLIGFDVRHKLQRLETRTSPDAE